MKPLNYRNLQISRNELRHKLTSTISIVGLTEYLENFQLNYWTGTYLKSQIVNGTITKNSISYNIIWLSSPETCYKSSQVVLSFKVPHRIYELEPYVVIDKRI